MKYRPKNCMKCGGKAKYQLGAKVSDEEIDLMFSRENRRPPNMRATTISPPPQVGQIVAPPPVPQITPYQGPGNLDIDWLSTVMGTKAILASISGRMENNRQDQYDQNQISQMSRPDFIDSDNYQPNPYSLYAKYGGSLKKYQTGGNLPVSTRVNRNFPIVDINKDKQVGKIVNDPYSVVALPDDGTSLPNDSIRFFPGQINTQGVPYMRDMGNMMGVTKLQSGLNNLLFNPRGRVYSDSTYMQANPEYLPKKQTGGRLVQQVPQGYQPLRTEGNRNYFGMQRSIAPAQRGQQGGGADYEQFLQQQLQSGISPEELVTKGYIAAPNAERYRPYYKEDIVYTEVAPAPVNQPQPAFQGEPIYENNKLVGFSRFSSRNSQTTSDPGNLATQQQMAEFMFADDMGKPTGEMYSIPGAEWSNTFTGGSRHLRTREGLDKYKVAPIAKFKKGGRTKYRGKNG